MPKKEKVGVKPDIGILTVLRHLPYRPWFALAEFVDNSIQSAETHLKKIKKIEGNDWKLEVIIELNPKNNEIRIRDNASGITQKDFPRAFRAAAAPPNTDGLCEFGMGMKSAACWFSPIWRVRTSALGEPVMKTVTFDLEKIVKKDLDELDVKTEPVDPDTHFTEIILENAGSRFPSHQMTQKKIELYLASIYRDFTREKSIDNIPAPVGGKTKKQNEKEIEEYKIRLENFIEGQGLLNLKLQKDAHSAVDLIYNEVSALVAPTYKLTKIKKGKAKLKTVGKDKKWIRDIDLDFGNGLKVSGFVGLSAVGNTRGGGFSLFRRRRLIEGLGDKKWRPKGTEKTETKQAKTLFGGTTTAVYQRLYGELHLDGFEVSHTKDGFDWDENEEPLIECLIEGLADYLLQAKNAPYRQTKKDLSKAVKEVITNAANENAPRWGEVEVIYDEEYEGESELPTGSSDGDNETRIISEEIHVGRQRWKIFCELNCDTACNDRWLTMHPDAHAGVEPEPNINYLGIRISLQHPFMTDWVKNDPRLIDVAWRIGAALALSEHMAERAAENLRYPNIIREKVNKLLKRAFRR